MNDPLKLLQMNFDNFSVVFVDIIESISFIFNKLHLLGIERLGVVFVEDRVGAEQSVALQHHLHFLSLLRKHRNLSLQQDEDVAPHLWQLKGIRK